MAFLTSNSVIENERISFGTLTRSRGKCHIALLGAEDAAGLSCIVESSDGTELPGRIVTTERGDVVLSLAVLPVKQNVTILRRAENGDRLIAARKVVHPREASLKSKVNSLLNNPTASFLRSSHALALEDFVSIDLLARDGDAEVLRGKVMYTKEEGSLLLHEPIEVLAIDRDTGKVISSGWTCLGDYAGPRKNYPGMEERTIDYSLRIPEGTSGFVIWARWSKTNLTLGFSAVYPEWADSLRLDWRSRTLFCDRDPFYHDWFTDSRRTDKSLLSLQRREFEGDAVVGPFFSIIVPLYNTPVLFFEEMAQSVQEQTYPFFELILVNASPDKEALATAVEELCQRDSRVKQIKLDTNYGITENTNAGIKAASGDFLVFLDHDDTIEADALFWYAQTVIENPKVDMIYCDEDHIKDGLYIMPFFKSDWDEELICAENYVCHMLAVRRELVMSLPDLPGREFDGSQDHNMTLVIGERSRAVAHIPKILYHWRIHDQSVAGAGIEQKPYALEAERIAVQNHLDRIGINARALMGARIPTRCDIEYTFERRPLVSIVIPNHDASAVLKRCLDSLFDMLTWNNYEIIIVENGSVETETFEYYNEICTAHDNVRVVSCELDNGFNFSRLINYGVGYAAGDYYLILNNDTEVISPDLLQLMMGPAQRREVGCVGAKLLYPDGLVQHAGVAVGRSFGPTHIGFLLPDSEPGYYERMVLPHQVSAVTAACLLTKREVYDTVGGFDESLPVDYNDIDFCLKVRARGFTVVEQVNAKMFHYESVSRGTEKSPEQLESLIRALGVYGGRWGEYLVEGDPYYSPNFAFDDIYCKLDIGELPAGATSLADFV